jgi:Thioredoxin like C-terminal domain
LRRRLIVSASIFVVGIALQDVDEQGRGTVTEQRLYQLIRQPKPIAERQFEIEFLDPGVETFAFTFV